MSEDLYKRIEQQEAKINALKTENEKLKKQLDKDEVNEEYKDRLFKFIFGNPENKQWTLALYNAVNGTAYEDPEAIQFNTIGGFLYLKMRNDISFIIYFEMNLWEHQSTFNPNMPMRFLRYGTRICMRSSSQPLIIMSTAVRFRLYLHRNACASIMEQGKNRKSVFCL